MNLEAGLIFSQIIAFVLMVWVLKKFTWKPLLKVLEERRQKIQSEFDLIDFQKMEVQRMIDLYNEKIKGVEDEAKVKIRQAALEGQKIADKIQEDSQIHAQEILSKAKQDVLQEIAKAKIELKTDLVNMVMVATEKLVEEKLNPEADERLIVDFIEKGDFK